MSTPCRPGQGGGAPILFLHALGLDLTFWNNQLASFGPGHDVVAIDLPGHGQSGSLDVPPTFDILARAVAGVVAGLGAGPAHIVGISVGGMVGQTLAITYPHLVRSLSLVATSCTFPDIVRNALRDRARATRAGGMGAMAPLHLERWFPLAFRQRRPDMLDRMEKTLLQQDAGFHASMWDMVATLDVLPRLSTLACPTMVVAGGADLSAPASAGQVIIDQIAGARLHVVDGSGHFPPIEFASDFNALLRSFLRSA